VKVLIYHPNTVLLASCLSIATFSILFGFSTTFEMALLSRFMLGLGELIERDIRPLSINTVRISQSTVGYCQDTGQ
jgi:hypothetical protein